MKAVQKGNVYSGFQTCLACLVGRKAGRQVSNCGFDDKLIKETLESLLICIYTEK